jgi:non-canonical poly(A) RNA polymerase PAPD5/7
MKPPHTHLTCRAPNRFSPSALLWQHFVAAYRPVLHHHRLSSTAAEPAPNGAHGDHGVPNRPEASGSTKLVDAARGKDAQPKTPTLRIMKQKTHNGTWKFTKAEASISKNAEKGHQQRLDSLTAPDQILASAKAAFEGGKDYDGVVVPPMESPIPCPEKRLPWCLAINERTMAGVDRLAVEIERFYDFAKPDHLEALARRHLIEQVRDHVREILPNHILEVFGSERTGLAMATSDIDLRLLLKEQLENPADPKLPPKPEQRTEAMKYMHKLHFNGLSKNKAYKLALLRYARYPLIALQDNQSGLDVQIVLSNDTSVSREIMTGYMEQYPYLRQLYCVVKTMFDVRGLSDVFRGGFGSYSLFMMVVASIKHSPNPRKDAAGGLINFLRLYQKLNTEKWGISIEPVWLFDKTENFVITEKTRAKMQVCMTVHSKGTLLTM